ncbi:MAG: YfiR family protein [Chitinispirillaceae bacterium]
MRKHQKTSSFVRDLKYGAIALKASLCLLMILFRSMSDPLKVSSFQLKAMFVEAALRFITWPDSSGREKNFIVGVYEEDRMVPYLEKVMQSRNINGRKVRFVYLESAEDASGCDLVFISESSGKNLAKILAVIRNRPILTATDSPELTYKGVIMSVLVENRKIRCYINNSQAAESKLEISHHLLRKSKIVSTEGERE